MQSLIAPVYAQVATNVVNPINGITNLSTLFNWIINLILAAGISLVVIFLALGFVRYVMSQGDKTAIEQAQKWVTYAAMGGVGLFLVFVIRRVIGSLFGVNTVQTGGNTQIGGSD
jgi:hypothetical protein